MLRVISRRTVCPAPKKGRAVPFWLLFVAILSFAGVSHAEFDAEKVTHGLVSLEKGHLYLFDRANHYKHAVKVKKDEKLLSNRVYLKYDDDLHMWVYFKTSFKGVIPSPFEALRPRTVTTGGVVGAELRLQRFMLAEDGTWTATPEAEIYRVFVKSKPPELRIYKYQPDPKALERQIAEDTKTSRPPLPKAQK